MKRGQKWGLGLGIAAAVLGGAWLAATWWLPSDEELSTRFTAAAEDELGVKVTTGSVHRSFLPSPAVVISDFRTQQAQPVVIRQLSAYLDTRMLLQRKLVIEHADIDGAVFPHTSLLAFHAKPSASEPGAGDGVPLKHLAFRNLT